MASTVSDANIDLISLYIAGRQNPSNIEISTAVNTELEAQVRQYLIWAREYIFGSNILEDIQGEATYVYTEAYGQEDIGLEQRYINLKAIQDNWIIIEDEVSKRILALNLEFQSRRILNNVGWVELFFFLSMVVGLVPLNKLLRPGRKMTAAAVMSQGETAGADFYASLYPLPNQTGFFTIEDYLRGVFNGVLIIGVPVRPNRFDAEFTTPTEFMTHDVIHSLGIYTDIYENSQILTGLQYVYSELIKEPNPLTREALLYHLWELIHESNWLARDLVISQGIKILHTVKYDVIKFPPELDDAFQNETLKWASFTHPHNIEDPHSRMEALRAWAHNQLNIRFPWL